MTKRDHVNPTIEIRQLLSRWLGGPQGISAMFLGPWILVYPSRAHSQWRGANNFMLIGDLFRLSMSMIAAAATWEMTASEVGCTFGAQASVRPARSSQRTDNK